MLEVGNRKQKGPDIISGPFCFPCFGPQAHLNVAGAQALVGWQS